MITKKFLHTFNLLGPQMYVPSLKSIDEIAWDIFFAPICLRSNVWHGICKISLGTTLKFSENTPPPPPPPPSALTQFNVSYYVRFYG